MEADTVREYLTENVAIKDPEEAKWVKLREYEARLERGEIKDEDMFFSSHSDDSKLIEIKQKPEFLITAGVQDEN